MDTGITAKLLAQMEARDVARCRQLIQLGNVDVAIALAFASGKVKASSEMDAIAKSVFGGKGE